MQPLLLGFIDFPSFSYFVSGMALSAVLYLWRFHYRMRLELERFADAEYHRYRRDERALLVDDRGGQGEQS